MAGLGYASWKGTSLMMSMIATVYAKPHLVLYIGFWSGFSVASICACLAYSLYRLTHIKPENAFNQTFAILKEHPKVTALLGEHLRDAKLKTYEITDGDLSWRGAYPRWMPHRVQMMYMVYGEKSG